VMIFAYMVPAFFLSIQLTESFFPQIGLITALGEGGLMDRLNGLHQELGFAEYTSNSKSMTDMFMITVALMVGTAGLPHVIIRFFTVPKVADARTSAGWALIFIALLYTTAPAIGLFARYNMIETVNGKIYETEAPQWVKTWEQTGLIKWEDKNGDGIIQYRGPKAPDGLANELNVDRDIMVLANPEIAGLPSWVIALVAAGGLAAALSTAAGLLLVISTSISHDLMKRIINPNLSESSELWYARGAAGGAVIIAGYFGINPPGFVAQVVAFAFGLAASSFFPVIIMGIFSKRTTKEGAISGMVAGIAFTAAYIIYFKFVNPDLNTAENWLFGVSPEGIGTIGMVLNFLVAFVISRFTQEVPEDVQEMIDHIRVPKGAGAAQSH
jgi:cation/acetate symporter